MGLNLPLIKALVPIVLDPSKNVMFGTLQTFVCGIVCRSEMSAPWGTNFEFCYMTFVVTSGHPATPCGVYFGTSALERYDYM